MDSEKVIIEIILNDESIITKEVLKRQIPKFGLVKVGLFLRTIEHAIYDVVDENGNILC